jgi:two-component system sensor histidine kinase VanS
MKRSVLRCVRVLLPVTAAYAGILIAGNLIVHSFTWQPSEFYIFLKGLERNIAVCAVLVWTVMAFAVIYVHWKKTARCIGDIAEASKALIQPDDTDIVLPEELREIEHSMNRIKKTALRNEREAREAEQRKNDLVVNLAHDIRTPLSSVIGYLSLLHEAPDMPPEQKARYIGITLEKACRLERLIEEFFEITRFNASSIVLDKGRIRLPFMLRQMADEFFPMLAPLGKKAVVRAPDDLVLWGDADKLARVFNNILKNAIAYSYENSTITITAFPRGKDAVIRFTNRGDPIPPQKLDTIFERFFRLDAARSSDTGGAGLGLAIAKEIVDAPGGSLRAQSDKSETVFFI